MVDTIAMSTYRRKRYHENREREITIRNIVDE